MRKLNNNEKEIEFLNIYNVAHDFMELVEDNYNPDVGKITNHLPGIPFFVNGFFAIELYIKAILKYDRRVYSNTHNLKKLFNTFTPKRKNSIIKKCHNIETFLDKNADAFDIWRYSFDDKNAKFKLWGSYGEIRYFLIGLESECKEIKEVLNND